jgi:hypothetical protein
MKRLMIITAVFALLLTGCGTRVSHDTLIELSVSSITEYQNRLNAIHPKDLQVSINELAQKEGLETRDRIHRQFYECVMVDTCAAPCK